MGRAGAYTLFKDVDWVARRTTTILGMERLCGMSLAHRMSKSTEVPRVIVPPWSLGVWRRLFTVAQ